MLTPLALFVNRNIQKVQADATISETARLMRDRRGGSLFIEKGGEYVGIVSESDLVHLAIADERNPEKTAVREIMRRPIISVDIDQSAKAANDLMHKRGTRHLAVKEAGKIVGVLSVRDLLNCFKNRP